MLKSTEASLPRLTLYLSDIARVKIGAWSAWKCTVFCPKLELRSLWSIFFSFFFAIHPPLRLCGVGPPLIAGCGQAEKSPTQGSELHHSRHKGALTNMLHELDLPTLQPRRKVNRLCFMYKISKLLVPAIPATDHLTGVVDKRKRKETTKYKDCGAGKYYVKLTLRGRPINIKIDITSSFDPSDWLKLRGRPINIAIGITSSFEISIER